MFKKVFILVTVYVFLVGMVTRKELESVKEKVDSPATESTATSETSQIKLTTVYEKTFDEEIVDVIFDTATVTVAEAINMGWKESEFEGVEKTRGKAKITYPKVVFYGKEEWRRTRAIEGYIIASKIVFYDKDGKVKRELRLGGESDYYINVSPNEKYIGVSKQFQKEGEKGKAAMLFDSEGNELLSFEKGQIVSPISDMGFVKYTPTSWDYDGFLIPICIYDLNKRKVVDYETLNPEIPNAEVGGDVFLEEGKYIFSWVSGVKKSVGKLIDVQAGKILWKKEYDFEITGDWRTVAGKEDLELFCMCRKEDYVYDIVALHWNTGEVLWSSRLGAPFSNILIDEYNNIYIAGFGYINSFTPKGKMRWYYEEQEKPVKQFYPYRGTQLTYYITLKLSGDQILSRGIIPEMIKGVWNWKSSEILSLSKKDGKVIKKERFTGKVMMSSKGGKLGIVTNDKVIKILK
ncbi:MAG: hypothetical protein ABIN61_04330 [candidate division WOR-3 bacterium]